MTAIVLVDQSPDFAHRAFDLENAAVAGFGIVPDSRIIPGREHRQNHMVVLADGR